MLLDTKHFEIVKWFQLNFPELTKDMHDCSHHYDEDNLNAYHLEGDIFTHTMMVYKTAELLSKDNDLVKWSTLLHDTGKPLSKEILDDKKKCRFIGHEGISAHIAVDILNKTDISITDKIKIFKLVAMHGDLFHHIKSDGTIKDDILKVFMGEKELLANLVHQVRADSLGRFYEDDKLSNTLFTHNLPEHFAPVIDKLSNGLDTVVNNDKPELIILVGAPCSEKSSTRNKLLIDNPDLVIISRDDLIESFAKKINLDYSETFKFLMDNKDIEVDEISNIIEALKTDIIKNNKSVLIDMTSMSKKSRRKWINSFPKHNAKCILFIRGYDELLKCNKKRELETGKKISKNVILNMLKSFALPMYSEGFTSIDYNWLPRRF